MKACVVYVLVVVILQTSFSFFEAWDGLVVNFGSFVRLSLDFSYRLRINLKSTLLGSK